MTKKTATPAEIIEAAALREAGFTVLSISQRLGISLRSLQRHFSKHGVKKGSIKEEVLEAARAEILKRVTSDQAIKEEAARIINDDLAHARHLRDLMINASEHLHATSLTDAVLVMRAAAAYSTAIKNTSDMLRHSLRIEKSIDEADRELPELVVKELTHNEIEELRSNQTNDVTLA